MASRRDLRDMAKERLRDALSVAYYEFVDGENTDYNELSEEDKEAVLCFIDQYGTAMCKAIGREYYILTFPMNIYSKKERSCIGKVEL